MVMMMMMIGRLFALCEMVTIVAAIESTSRRTPHRIIAYGIKATATGMATAAAATEQ